MKLFERKSAIKIEEDDLKDAKLSSLDFSDESTKKRAFINVLGARLAMKMLFSQKIDATNLYSLYTIHNVIGELDIADIYFQGIKIDVRLVFNRDEIFIPKSHFKYDLLPDLYLVLELAKDFSCAEVLGFFEPKALNTKNANKDFYFYEYDKLNDPKTIKEFLDDFVVEDSFNTSQGNLENTEELFLSLVDKDISAKDKYALFKQLAETVSLREKMVEFENFEILAKESAKNNSVVQDKVLDIVGAQQLFEDEDLNQSKEEMKAEVIEEVLSDLLEENTDSPDMELDEEFLKELTGEASSETKPENKNTGGSNAAALSAGVVLGAAVGGVAAAAVAGIEAESDLIKSGVEVLSTGIGLVDDFVKDSADISSEEIFNKLLNEEKEMIEETEASKYENLEVEQESDFQISEPLNFEETPSDIEFEIEDKLENDLFKEEILPEIEPEKENLTEDLILSDEENQFEEGIDLKKLNESIDFQNNFGDDLQELENLENLKGTIEAKYFGNTEEEEEESDTEVIDLKDFDFEMLNEQEQERKQETEPEANSGNNLDENLVSFDAISSFGEANIILPEQELESEFVLDDINIISEETENKEEEKGETKTLKLGSLEIVQDPDFYTPDSPIETESHASQSNDIVFQPEVEKKSEEGYDDDTIKKLREIEEDEDESQDQDKSDDFISQVDAFLKDADFSKEKAAFLEEALDLDLDLDLEEEPAISPSQTSQQIYSPNVLPEDFEEEDDILKKSGVSLEAIQAKDDKDEINLLFNEEKNDNMPNLTEEKTRVATPSILSSIPSIKDKKMIIAASVASVIFVSVVFGGNLHKNNDITFPKNMSEAPISTQEQTTGELQQDNTASLDMSQQIPGQSMDTLAQQAIPEGNQQQAALNRDMGKSVSDAFLSEPVNANVSKVAWEVPEEFAYNDGFRKYLQIAGKNLKLNLQNNLLLANEMAYSNKVIVDLAINKDGSLLSENLMTSSGSKQIDKIVLQSVKETLMYLKMPPGELSGNSVSATLIINF